MSQAPTHETAQPLSESPVAISPTRHARSMDKPEVGGSAGQERSSQKPWWKRNFWEAREGNKRRMPLGEAPNVSKSLLAIVRLSWSNILLIFIPLSWTFYFAELSDNFTFIFSILAIIPLAKLGSFAADELSIRLGPVVACLLEVTLRHTVELIIAIIALVHCELDVVRTALIGSILSNLLLVLGMIFLTSGIRSREKQLFNKSAAQVDSCLLTLSVIAVLLPAAFHNALQPTGGTNPAKNPSEVHDILSISYGVAIILLFVYSCYLIFQVISHRNLFEPSIQETVTYSPALARKLHNHRQRTLAVSSSCHPDNDGVRSLEAGPVEDKGVAVPHMNLPITIGLFLLVAVAVAITVEAVFGSTDDFTVNMTFVSLILLPNLANAAEYWDIINLMVQAKVPVEDNLTVFLGSAMGSSIQIALFIIPLTVILGWILGKPLTLLFDTFESLVLFFSVLTVNYVVQGGKSNWLKGMVLICLYAIVGVTLWYYPGSDPSGALVHCT